MTSFIVASTNKKKREEYIANYCDKLEIDKFDVTIIEKDNQIKQNAQSIGIDEIKNLQKKIFLMPIKSPTKAVIVEDAHLMTVQAQNALLKVLEEPPERTIIMLSTESKEALLPTILSRCQIIELSTETAELSDEEKAELSEFIENLEKLTIGERLKKAEELGKDKDKAVEWIGKLILVLRDRMLNDETDNAFLAIKSFQRLHALLKTTNVNPRFAIENTFLSL